MVASHFGADPPIYVTSNKYSNISLIFMKLSINKIVSLEVIPSHLKF